MRWNTLCRSRNIPTAQRLYLSLSLILALGLWYVVFVLPWGIFWIKISLAASLLAAVSITVMGESRKALLKPRLRHLALGMLSAGLLYAVFWMGRAILLVLYSEARPALAAVYAPRGEISLWAVTVLLFFVTGPCEEIFWRGGVQRLLGEETGRAAALFCAALLYSLVHIWTLNLPLMLAALVAGLFWGFLFHAEKSLFPGIVSHSVWSVLIFVLFPLT
jgi:membrane protease YdiL (CAAX protease family)